MRRGTPLPGVRRRIEAILAPILADARAAALRVTSIEDARTLDRLLRARWTQRELTRLLRPLERAIRAHVAQQWGRQAQDCVRLDSVAGAWATRAALGVRRLFGSLRRGAVQALRRAAAIGASISETVAGWREALPTRRGTLEQRLYDEVDHRAHQATVAYHREEARRVRARWTWETQQDDLVRDSHEQLQGSEYAYDEQPSIGLPGEEPGCRCWQEWRIT